MLLSDTSSTIELRREILRLADELEAARAEIARLETTSHEDLLTGLLNRRGFERDLNHAIQFVRRYKSKLGLLMVDLDRFKPINDRLGHPAGDALLRHVGNVLSSQTRSSDSIARLGGDEFALILWQVDAVSLQHKAFALEQALAIKPLMLGGEAVTVSASVGGVMVNPAEPRDLAMQRADEALYARKHARAAAGLR